MSNEEELQDLKKTVKRLRARLKREVRRGRRLEKEADFATNVVETVRDSVALMPEIEIPTIPESPTAESDEVAFLVLSDSQIGKKTRTYNHNRFVKRLRKLEAALVSVVDQHRTHRRITKLVIFMGGDLVDADSVYPGQAIDYIDLNILEQLFDYGLPELTAFLMFCLDNFEEVEVHAVKGNHGNRRGRAKWTSSKSTNWDLILYKALEAMTRNQERLTWYIEDEDYKAQFRIKGHGFMCTHGDMIRRYYSTPFYGWQRQAQRWQGAFRSKIKLTHFVYCHFHTLCRGQRFNDLWIYANGSFITDDTFAEENLGVASKAEQLLMGVHEKYGVSWTYALDIH